MRATGCSTAACNPTLPSRSRLSGSPAPTTVCIPSTSWISARSHSYLSPATQDQGTCPPSPPRVLRRRRTNQGGRPMKVSGGLIQAIVGLLRSIGWIEYPQRELELRGQLSEQEKANADVWTDVVRATTP